MTCSGAAEVILRAAASAARSARRSPRRPRRRRRAPRPVLPATRGTASRSGPAASGTTSSARASVIGAPMPRRWHTQAASARVAPSGSRPAARSARRTGHDPDRQLLRAVGGDPVQAVVHARVREAVEQRGAIGRDVLRRLVEMRRRLGPPLLDPTAARVVGHGLGHRRMAPDRSRRRRAASGRR